LTFSVIVLNWNGREHLAGCLDSLKAQTIDSFEVLVVDNGSTDGSAEFLQENYGDFIRLIRSPENLGFAAGNNLAMGQARGTYFALLNNDAVAAPDWLELAAAAMESDPQAGMCAVKILNHDNRRVIDNTGHLIYRDGLNRGRGRLEEDHGQYDRETDAFFPSGCAAVYRRAMIDEVGGFDEDFFAYGDDTDLGLKGRLAGWSCIFQPMAVVYHKYSGSTGHYSPFKAFHVERNRIWIAVKYFPLTTLLANPFYAGVRYVLQAWGALTGRGAAGRFAREQSPWQLAWILVRANAAALGGLPRMLSRRRQARRLTRVKASEIRSWFRRYRISAAELALKE
jgi:GT2 family glycosyltransferase